MAADDALRVRPQERLPSPKDGYKKLGSFRFVRQFGFLLPVRGGPTNLTTYSIFCWDFRYPWLKPSIKELNRIVDTANNHSVGQTVDAAGKEKKSMNALPQNVVSLVPPFTKETAIRKVRAVEDNWNTRDPERVARGYTDNCYWRNRSEFLNGRAEVIAFLTRKWSQELEYRLIKELWAFEGNRLAVRFAYESHDSSGQWHRSYGNENWEFDAAGLSKIRYASINDLSIKEQDRLFHWPLGRRPDDHPGLTGLGL